MRNIVTQLVLSTTLLSLTGCTYFSTPPIIQGRDKAYLSANTIPPLRVPPGLSASGFRNDYPIPNYSYPDSAKAVSTIPPGIKS